MLRSVGEMLTKSCPDYEVRPLPSTLVAQPSFSVGSSVHISIHTVSETSFPVVPMRSSVVHSASPSYPVQPMYAVHTPPVKSYVAPSAHPSPKPHYSTRKPVVYSSAAVQSSYGVHTPPHSVAAVQPSYAAHAPPYSVAAVQPSYAVHKPPVHSIVAVQSSYGVHTPAHSSAAVHVSSVVHPPAPSIAAVQPSYAVHHPPSHSIAAVQSSYGVHTPHSSAAVHVSSVVHPPAPSIAAVQPSYAVHHPPSHSIAAVQSSYGVHTPHSSAAVHVSSVVHPPAPSIAAVESSYAVHQPPAHPIAAAQHSYGVQTPGSYPPNAVHVSSTAHMPPTHPAAVVHTSYAAHKPAAYPVAAVQPAYGVQRPPAYSSAPVHPSYNVQQPPAYSSVLVQPAYSSQKPPVDPPHTVQPTYYSQPPAYSTPTPYHSQPPAVDPSGYPDTPAPHGHKNCEQKCTIKCQTADIAFDVTQCRKSCLSSCGGKSDAGVRVGNNYAPAEIPGSPGNKKPGSAKGKADPGPAVGAGAVTYEACMKSCQAEKQSANIAFDVSQGEKDCRAACVHYASSGVGIVGRRDEDAVVSLGERDSVAVRSKKPPPPSPAIGVGATTYEACMEHCHAKYQHADIAFDVSQGKMDCETACARYASSGVGIFGKRAELEPRSKKPQPAVPEGPGVYAGATSYETCMENCHGQFQHADIAFDVSQGKMGCKKACARYASSAVGVFGKREELAVRGKKPKPPPPGPAVGAGATMYEACMSDCWAKGQHADIAFDVSTGEMDCKSACARYASSGVGIFGKREKPVVRSKKPKPPPPGPMVGAAATMYEACMSDCRAKGQHADIAFDVSTGEMDCKSACARAASSRVGIFDKKDSIAKRSKPKPVTPVVGASATMYEACMSDCHSKYQHAGIPFDVSQGQHSCKVACAKYADSSVGILDKKDDKKDSLTTRSKHPEPVGPSVGAGATTYEACMRDCQAQYQSADIAFVVSQGKSRCKTACARGASSGVGIFGKKDEIPDDTHDSVPNRGNGDEDYD
ncbi:hypothetical protein GGS21DRAFT_139926 [Xylaria nigripes]|nr:hypothetical protein GGS21DRAFT_139926 [Xylaria nigripes]